MKTKIFGVVKKKLPNSIFLIKLISNNKNILCYISGKMKINYIRILPGDKVLIEIDKFGNKGRIIYRIK